MKSPFIISITDQRHGTISRVIILSRPAQYYRPSETTRQIMKVNNLVMGSMVLFSISAIEIFVLDLGKSEIKKWYGDTSDSVTNKIQVVQSAERRNDRNDRRNGPQNRQTFIRPTRPFRFPAVFNPTAFLLPAFVGNSNKS